MVVNIQEIENGFHNAVATGTTALTHLYHLGQAIKNDTTYAAVDKDSALSTWEQDLIKVLIFLKPLFDYIVSKWAALKSLIEWAEQIYQSFSSQGKMPTITAA